MFTSFPGKKCTVLTLFALREGGWGSNFQEKKHYVTLNGPLIKIMIYHFNNLYRP